MQDSAISALNVYMTSVATMGVDVRLIDPTDRYTMVAIDPEALRELIVPILDSEFPDWSTEESHDDHSYHDEPSMHSSCIHCRIYRAMNGNGWIVAAAQVALSVLRDR